MKPTDMRIPLLTNCDNVSSQAVEGILAEPAKHGTVNVRHAHGDWKSSYLNGWVERLHLNAIRPFQQFAYTNHKNATDAAMIIDAMYLFYSKNVDGFALVTNGSDFTPLVMRIQESGLPVFGFGEKKTPPAFVHACSQFIFIENLMPLQATKSEQPQPPVASAGDRQLIEDRALEQLLRNAVEQTSEIDGWSHLSKGGKYISNTSSFSPLNYGYKKLGEVLRASGLSSMA